MPKAEAQTQSNPSRVRLAVVGKHPGWNDHLDDIGLETERLVDVKRHLYVESIGGLINAGTWEELSPAERDEGFAHTFFWRDPAGVIVGRIWSSTDGKGRAKYPMIACVQCRELPFAVVAGPVLARLRRFEQRCKEVTTADEVIAEADRAQGDLADLTADAPTLNAAPIAGGGAGPGSAGLLADSGALGDQGVGVKRVLYQIHREMGAFRRTEASTGAPRSSSIDVRGQHLRVPAPGGAVSPANEPDAIGLWARLLSGEIDQAVPLLILTKDGKPWVDAIVGELSPTTIACLQSTTESLPFVSDIPFTIDPETSASLDATIEASRAGESTEPDPCFLEAPHDRAFLRGKRTETVQAEGGSRSPIVFVAIAVVLVALIAVAMLAMRGGSAETTDQHAASGTESSETETSPTQATETPAPKVAPAPDPVQTRAERPEPERPEEITETRRPQPANLELVLIDVPTDPAGRLDAFRLWCDLAGSWHPAFVETLEAQAEKPFRADPEFAANLRQALDAVETAGDAADPLISTPGRFRSLETLRESPPDAIYDTDFAETLATGLRPYETVRAVFSRDRWPARDRLESLIRQATEAGSPPPQGIGDHLATMLTDLDSTDGTASAQAVLGTASLAPIVEATTRSIERLETARSKLESSAPESIQAAFAMRSAFDIDALPSESESEWLNAVATSADVLAAQGMQLATAATERLPKADPDLLAERMHDAPEPADAASATEHLHAWLVAVNDRSLELLDPADDPRRGLAGEDAVVRTRDALASLTQENENPETRELAGMLDAYTASAGSLAALSWNASTQARIEADTADLIALLSAIDERIDAERRTRALEAESYIRALTDERSISETGSPAIDSAWNESVAAAIERYNASPDIVELSRAADALRAGLGEIESSMPRPAPFAETETPASSALVQQIEYVIETEREQRIAQALADGADRVQASSEYAAWAEGVNASVRAHATLSEALASWKTGDADRYASAWAESWLGEQVEWQDEEPGVAALVSAVQSASAGELRALADDAGTHPAARFAAWSRLDGVEPSWPSSLAAIEEDADVVRALRSEAADSLEGDRAQKVLSEITEIATRRWVRAAGSSAADDFARIAALADDLGIDRGRLTPALRFNLFITGLRTDLDAGEEPERDAIAGEAESLAALMPSGSDARTWLAGFIDELEAREGREIDYRVIGPARAGWAVEPFDAGRTLRYSWAGDGERRELTFHLVESPGAGVFYLCETEAPVWLLTEYALGGAQADSVRAALPADWDPLPDTRLGPRVWEWGRRRGGREIRLARVWVDQDRGSDRALYPDSIAESVGRPGENHPIQRVSAKAAAVLAAAAGCRLPTVAEWGAAFEQIGRPEASAEWQLRDTVFDRQRAHTLSHGAGVSVVWPDQHSFADGLDGVPSGADAASHPWSDGVLWFAPVNEGRTRDFRHLIGNVAEYVIPDLSDKGLLTDRGGVVDERVRAVGGRAVTAQVIGGSSLSPPSVRLDEPAATGADSGDLGYTDVGFRLAFSPGVEAPFVVVLRELIGDAPFLRVDE